MLARCVLCTERRGTDWVMPHDEAGVSWLGDEGACFRLPQSNSNAMDDNCACELNLLHLNMLYTQLGLHTEFRNFQVRFLIPYTRFVPDRVVLGRIRVSFINMIFMGQRLRLTVSVKRISSVIFRFDMLANFQLPQNDTYKQRPCRTQYNIGARDLSIQIFPLLFRVKCNV